MIWAAFVLCALPSDSVFVESPTELRAVLADPAGPAVVQIAPGVFSGNWIIRRPLRLIGSLGTVLEGSGDDTVLALDGHDIRIEQLILRHSGRRNTSEDAGVKARGERITIADVTVLDTLFGVALEQCKACSLERARVFGDPREIVQGDGIKLWESHGSRVSDCSVEHARDVVVWYSRNVQLSNNEVRGSRYGTHFMYAHDVSVNGGRFVDNVVGVFIMYSNRVRLAHTLIGGGRGAAGMGVGIKESENVQIVHSTIVANTTGVYVDRSPRIETEPVRLTASLVALNGVAVRLHSSQRGIVVSGNDFANNISAMEVDGGGSALGLQVTGNHWSDYEGFDLDRDGVGDVAFEVKALSRVWTDEAPALAFFRESFAMHAIDVVAQALPIVAARLLLSDPSPRMEGLR